MNNPSLTYSNDEYPIYEQLSSGQYIYYFDRNETIQLFEDQEKTVYTSIAIYFNSKPTYKEAVKKVIRLYLSESEEFDLINSAYLGDDEEYKEWLNKLQEIKGKIKEDFNNI